MENNIYNSSCLIKSYTSDVAIQNWIADIKKRGYTLTFFDTQYDSVNRKVVYTAVMELDECKK